MCWMRLYINYTMVMVSSLVRNLVDPLSELLAHEDGLARFNFVPLESHRDRESRILCLSIQSIFTDCIWGFICFLFTIRGSIQLSGLGLAWLYKLIPSLLSQNLYRTDGKKAYYLERRTSFHVVHCRPSRCHELHLFSLQSQKEHANCIGRHTTVSEAIRSEIRPQICGISSCV